VTVNVLGKCIILNVAKRLMMKEGGRKTNYVRIVKKSVKGVKNIQIVHMFQASRCVVWTGCVLNAKKMNMVAL
jgi:hypothetical protein